MKPGILIRRKFFSTWINTNRWHTYQRRRFTHPQWVIVSYSIQSIPWSRRAKKGPLSLYESTGLSSIGQRLSSIRRWNLASWILTRESISRGILIDVDLIIRRQWPSRRTMMLITRPTKLWFHLLFFGCRKRENSRSVVQRSCEYVYDIHIGLALI